MIVRDHRRLGAVLGVQAAVAVSFVLAGTKTASAVPWANPSGVNPVFGWSNGQNETDKFGSPQVTEVEFTFVDMNNFREGEKTHETRI